MIVRTREEAQEFGVQSVDVENILVELQDWIKSYQDDGDCDAVRFAMINSFEDIILNAIVEE